MRTFKKWDAALDILEKLVVDGLIIEGKRPEFGRRHPEYYRPGWLINNCDEEARAKLRTVTADDLNKCRLDHIMGLVMCCKFTNFGNPNGELLRKFDREVLGIS